MQMRNSSSVIQPVGLLAQTGRERTRKKMDHFWTEASQTTAKDQNHGHIMQPDTPFSAAGDRGAYGTCLIYPAENRPLEFE